MCSFPHCVAVQAALILSASKEIVVVRGGPTILHSHVTSFNRLAGVFLAPKMWPQHLYHEQNAAGERPAAGRHKLEELAQGVIVKQDGAWTISSLSKVS